MKIEKKTAILLTTNQNMESDLSPDPHAANMLGFKREIVKMKHMTEFVIYKGRKEDVTPDNYSLKRNELVDIDKLYHSLVVCKNQMEKETMGVKNMKKVIDTIVPYRLGIFLLSEERSVLILKMHNQSTKKIENTQKELETLQWLNAGSFQSFHFFKSTKGE